MSNIKQLSFVTLTTAAVAFFLMGLLTSDTAATTLEFVVDGNIQDTTDPLIHTYGSDDDVADALGIAGYDTPNVSVEWGLVTPAEGVGRYFVLEGPWNGQLTNVLFFAPPAGQVDPPTDEIIFTADEGYLTRVDSIVVGNNWVDSPGNQDVTWTVQIDGGTPTDYTMDVPYEGTATFDFTGGGYGSVVKIYMKDTELGLGGTLSDFLKFSQVPVPEPSSLTLLAVLVGLGLVAYRKR